MRRQSGFTIPEMMVVLAISLALIAMIVPIFTVSTKTVQNVEEKLAAYEAARNILDAVEKEVRQTMLNERGEHFSVKHVPYQDTDTFTPQQVSPPALDTTWYAYSRREACVINFQRPQPGSMFNNSTADRNTTIDGAQVYPLAYPNQIAYQPAVHEAWYESVRSSLFYPPASMASGNTNMSSYASPLTRTQLLADVGQPEISMYLQARDNEPDYNWYNEPAFRLAPGNELTAEKPFHDYIDQYDRMHIGGMTVLDFNVAYWNDTDAKFYNVDDYSVVYFSPPPKAVRLTITVCDTAKRKRVTLSRVVQIPVGIGGQGVVYNMGQPPDPTLAAPPTPLAANPVPIPQTYNRIKNLKLLEPQILGP